MALEAKVAWANISLELGYIHCLAGRGRCQNTVFRERYTLKTERSEMSTCLCIMLRLNLSCLQYLRICSGQKTTDSIPCVRGGRVHKRGGCWVDALSLLMMIKTITLFSEFE